MNSSRPISVGYTQSIGKQACDIVSPAPREIWHELLQCDTIALNTQTPLWLDCICAVGNYQDASRLYELSDGQQLILPMVRSKGLPLPLSVEASLPFAWGRGGLVSRKPLREEDIATVFADLMQRPVLSTTLRPSALTGEKWTAAAPSKIVSMPRLAHVLDLQGGFDEFWSKQLNTHTRNKIRKAERSGLVVELDTTGKLIPVFYELLLKSLDRWGQQQHEPLWLTHMRGKWRDPLRKFELIAQMLGEACRVWVAWLDNQPVAARIVIIDKNAYQMRSAMDKELAGPTRANDLLTTRAIEDACQAGCRYYYMGESGASAELSHFKSRFGAVGYPYEEYHIERVPLTSMDRGLRGIIKRFIGFKDV